MQNSIQNQAPHFNSSSLSLVEREKKNGDSRMDSIEKTKAILKKWSEILNSLEKKFREVKGGRKTLLNQVRWFSRLSDYLVENRGNFYSVWTLIFSEQPAIGIILNFTLELLDVIRKKIAFVVDLAIDLGTGYTFSPLKKQLAILLSIEEQLKSMKNSNECLELEHDFNNLWKKIYDIQEGVKQFDDELKTVASSNCKYIAAIVSTISVASLGFIEFLKVDKIAKSLNDLWKDFDKLSFLNDQDALLKNYLSEIQGECLEIEGEEHLYDQVGYELLAWSRKKLQMKFEEERIRITFEKKMILVKLCYSFIQFCLIFPEMQRGSIKMIGDILFLNLLKAIHPNLAILQVFNPINPIPTKEIVVIRIAMYVACHFREIKYIPHQCSLNGYIIKLKIDTLNLFKPCISLLQIVHRGILWCNILLVENCVQGLNQKKIFQSSRFLDLGASYAEYEKNYDLFLADLELEFYQLKVKDVDLQFPANRPMEILKEDDIQYFPKETLDHFQCYYGCRLRDPEITKERLQEKMEKFFTQDRRKILQALEKNRLLYLKSLSRMQ
ncbi:MAG: hypothetical protein ACH350_09880 [Parachlamydiaceae bacterium]